MTKHHSMIQMLGVQIKFSYSKGLFLQCRRVRFDPWIRKIPWRRKWHLTPVFLPGEFHGRRRLVGYSPGDGKQQDTTEQLRLSLSFTQQRELYFLNMLFGRKTQIVTMCVFNITLEYVIDVISPCNKSKYLKYLNSSKLYIIKYADNSCCPFSL